MAVGDPDQSIYAFRGADIRNILEFERDFPDADVALEQNYRSANAILQAANAVISHNHERKEKNLWSELGEGEPVRVIETEDEHGEARYVAGEIVRLVDKGSASARSPSSTAPTPRAGCSRTCSCGPVSATRCSAGSSSTSAPRSATRSPTCG